MPTLTVTLLSASDLPASDTGAFQGGKSDPYVHFQLGPPDSTLDVRREDAESRVATGREL
ncbi:hypothetical protein PINS_up002782 [Pythium insidiosum]|nr:hypothetical protein PINS_up002782 [Pythium insidiosum]